MVTKQTINSFFGCKSTMFIANHKFNGIELFQNECDAILFVNEKQLTIQFNC